MDLCIYCIAATGNICANHSANKLRRPSMQRSRNAFTLNASYYFTACHLTYGYLFVLIAEPA